MAKLMQMLQPLQSEYVDRRFDGTKEEYFKQLELSSTLYIGNLSFYTTEDQIYELFSKVGVVARVIIGLDRNTKTPCGFCFVIYHRRADALAAVKHLNGTKLDSRQLRVDIDPGFEEGRQFGRGRSGGQVRDEFRTDFDADRGGYGHVVAQQLAQQQLAMWQEVQAGAALGAGLLPGDAAIFFNQAQAALPGAEQQAAAAAEGAAGEAAAAAAEEAGNEAGSNPRLRGRGAEANEDEDDGQVQKRKRQRLGAEAAGGQQPQEQEQQLEQDAADVQATAAPVSEEFETIEDDAPADADAAAQQEDEREGGDAE